MLIPYLVLFKFTKWIADFKGNSFMFCWLIVWFFSNWQCNISQILLYFRILHFSWCEISLIPIEILILKWHIANYSDDWISLLLSISSILNRIRLPIVKQILSIFSNVKYDSKIRFASYCTISYRPAICCIFFHTSVVVFLYCLTLITHELHH